MFKLIAFFAILAAAFAVPAPEPKPKPDPLTLYAAGGAPLTYNAYQQYQPVSYSGLNGLGYNYLPYAYNYNYYAPLAYRNLYL